MSAAFVGALAMVLPLDWLTPVLDDVGAFVSAAKK
jgi:hypothetical protein